MWYGKGIPAGIFKTVMIKKAFDTGGVAAAPSVSERISHRLKGVPEKELAKTPVELKRDEPFSSGRKGLAAGGESENRVAPRGKFNSSPLAVWLQGSGEFLFLPTG